MGHSSNASMKCGRNSIMEKSARQILDIEELRSYIEQEVCNRIPFACMGCAVCIPFYHDAPLAGRIWLLIMSPDKEIY